MCCRWYNIALWPTYPSFWPPYIACVWAPSPCAAIFHLMRRHSRYFIRYASARAQDGSIWYEGYKLTILSDVQDTTEHEQYIDSLCQVFQAPIAEPLSILNEIADGCRCERCRK